MILALTLIGCGPGALDAGFEADLTDLGGCADVFVYARTPAQDVGMSWLSDDGLVAAAVAADAPVQRSYELPNDAGDLAVAQGSTIGEVWCNDVSTGAQKVLRTWAATAGSVDVTVTPDDAGTGTADVTVTDAVFEDGDGATVTMPAFSWTDIHVGWLAG